jgi:HPt (histidine-containing phosphotransfer) domain-containing protein
MAASDAPFYSVYGDDPDMGEIVEMFVDEMPERVELLKQLLEAEDWEGVGCFAHQMKGACGSYGFDQLTLLAQRLERAARGGEPEEMIRRSLEDLAEGFRRARAGSP